MRPAPWLVLLVALCWYVLVRVPETAIQGRSGGKTLLLLKKFIRGHSVQRAVMPVTRPADPQLDKVRRGLLVLAVRDTLQKHHIPSQWISAEAHSAMTTNRIRGMHLRLVVREWQPSLLPYSIALQRAIIARLMRLDPLSASWLAGVSWRYDVVDDSTCPVLPKDAPWNQPQGHTPVQRVPITSASGLPTDDRVPDFQPTVPMSIASR